MAIGGPGYAEFFLEMALAVILEEWVTWRWAVQ